MSLLCLALDDFTLQCGKSSRKRVKVRLEYCFLSIRMLLSHEMFSSLFLKIGLDSNLRLSYNFSHLFYHSHRRATNTTTKALPLCIFITEVIQNNSPANDVRCISVNFQDGGQDETAILNISRTKTVMTKLWNKLLFFVLRVLSDETVKNLLPIRLS